MHDLIACAHDITPHVHHIISYAHNILSPVQDTSPAHNIISM